MKFSNKNTKIWSKFYQKLTQKRKKANIYYSKGKIFASASGVNCEYYLRYLFDGTEKKSDFYWWGHEAQIGNAIHDEIQSDFRHSYKDKVKIETYQAFKIGDITINAKIDLIKDDRVIEFKTVKDEEGREPREKDYMQLQFYMGVTGLNSGTLSYFKRSNGVHINSFDVQFDEKVFRDIVEKFERVLENKELREDKSECQYCDFKYCCPKFGG